MVKSKKSYTECARCKYLLDACVDSPFPISCDNTGETETEDVPLYEKARREFKCGDGVAIPRFANCPNFKVQEEGWIPIRDALFYGGMNWPTDKCLAAIAERQKRGE